MEVLFTASWALVGIALLWAVVGLVRYVRFARHERTLRPDAEAELLPEPIRVGPPLPRPQLPERDRYQRTRSRRVVPGESPVRAAHRVGEAGEDEVHDEAPTASVLDRLDRFYR